MNKRRFKVPHLQNIDLRLLRVFETVARHEGYGGAQTELNIAPSSISEHMTRLESRLGVKLCQRGRSGFQMTLEGEQVLQQTRKLLTALEGFQESIGDILGDFSGTLRFGLIDAVAELADYRLSKIVGRFAQAAPNVYLDMQIDSPQELVSALEDGGLDIIVAPVFRQIPSIDWVDLDVANVQHLACSRAHPLYGRPDSEIDLSDIGRFPFVARTHMQGWSHPQRVAFNTRATTSFIEGMLPLILSGAYIGYLPEHIMRAPALAERLRAVKPDRLSYDARICIGISTGTRSQPATLLFEIANSLAP